jgi:hypothetical protein
MGQFGAAGQPLPVTVAGHGARAECVGPFEAVTRVEPFDPPGQVAGGEGVARADDVDDGVLAENLIRLGERGRGC